MHADRISVCGARTAGETEKQQPFDSTRIHNHIVRFCLSPMRNEHKWMKRSTETEEYDCITTCAKYAVWSSPLLPLHHTPNLFKRYLFIWCRLHHAIFTMLEWYGRQYAIVFSSLYNRKYKVSIKMGKKIAFNCIVYKGVRHSFRSPSVAHHRRSIYLFSLIQNGENAPQTNISSVLFVRSCLVVPHMA